MVGNNRSDFFDGMQIIAENDGTFEVSEYMAGKNENELHIYLVTKSLTLALKDLIKGNKRKPIKKYFKTGGMIGFTNDPIYSKGNISVQRIGGSSMWNVAINKKSVGRVLNAFTKEQAFSKAQKEKFANGGEVNSSTQKLIEQLKKNSNESVSDVMTNKQGEKYRFRNWKLKYNSASNFLVKLFEKASEENTGKSYNRNFYNGDYSFYYNRPEMKNKPNGSMQMRMLEVLNRFKAGGMVEFYDYKGVEIMYEPNEKEYYANDMVFYSLEDAHEYIDSGEANKTPKHIENLYRRGAMAKGGNVGSQDLYKLAEKMSEKDFRNKFLTLSKSEKENVESLIRLGDDKKIALITILDKRNEPNNNDFYRQAYHYKAGGDVEDEKVYIDLFEDYENIPANVQIILDEYSESFEDGDYIGMSKAQDELEQIGYTFNFYVDGDAYGLRPTGIKLSQLKGYEDADEE